MEKFKKMKLNVGCGTDIRDGFINIDGSNTLLKVDKVIDIAQESLLDHFEKGGIEYILANDIIEHHFHWEAVRILGEFYRLLRSGGVAEIRVPDTEFIIKSRRFPLSRKLTMLYGGQDIPLGRDLEMDESRKKFPKFFCHKFGWTMKTMKEELLGIGFSAVRCKRAGMNFITYATK